MIVMFMPGASRGSWGEIELFGAPRRIGFPAAAGRAMPVELARLEAAGLAAVAREAARVAVDEVAHQLQVAAPVRVLGGDDLRLEQAVQAEQRRVAAQLVAHEGIGGLDALRVQGLLEHGIEEVERRIALEVAREEPQPLVGAPRVAVGLQQALRDEREVRGVLGLDALPGVDGLLRIARILLEVAQLQARAHALAVRLERGLEVAARRVRARL